jgi:hypothetical protein
MSSLILKHTEWEDDDYDLLADGVVVGRIMHATAAPLGTPWMWTLIFGHHRRPHAHARLRADARGRDGGVCAGAQPSPLSGA